MAGIHTLTRREFLKASGLMLAGTALAACAPAQASDEMPVTGADQALERLLEGNRRYAANKSVELNESASRRAEVASGQSPFATIFSCVDSRVPPELIFDRGLGDLFVTRTAGQVLDSAVLGSLQFGVVELGIPLLLVLGHENCGAVKATVEAVEHNAAAEGEINWLVDGIRPAVEAARTQSGDPLDNAVRANILLTVERLRQAPILAQAIEEMGLKVLGARYDLNTGLVEVIA